MAREAAAPGATAIPGLKPMAPIGAPLAAAAAPAAATPVAPMRVPGAAPQLVGTIEGTMGFAHIAEATGHHSYKEHDISQVLRRGIVTDPENRLCQVELQKSMHLGSLAIDFHNPTDHGVLVDVVGLGAKTHGLQLNNGEVAIGTCYVGPGKSAQQIVVSTQDAGAGNAAAAAGMPDVAAIRETFNEKVGDRFSIAAKSPLFDYLQATARPGTTAFSPAIQEACKTAMLERSQGAHEHPIYGIDRAAAYSYLQAIEAERAKADSTSFDPKRIGVRITRAHPWESLPDAFNNADTNAPAVQEAAAKARALPDTFHYSITAQVSAPVERAERL